MCIRDRHCYTGSDEATRSRAASSISIPSAGRRLLGHFTSCLLYTSDAADERSSVDLGGRRIIKKKKQTQNKGTTQVIQEQTT